MYIMLILKVSSLYIIYLSFYSNYIFCFVFLIMVIKYNFMIFVFKF